MMRAVPDNWFSWNFSITDDGNTLAKISFSWVRQTGKLHIEGKDYKIYRENLFSGAFVLEGDGRELARAEKPSALFRSFEVSCDGKSYTLEALSALKRAFSLRESGRTTGSIRPEHAFTRKAVIELPDEIELPVRIFMVWLTLLLWKREEESATQ